MDQFCYFELKVYDSKDFNEDLKYCILKEDSNYGVDYFNIFKVLFYFQLIQKFWKC